MSSTGKRIAVIGAGVAGLMAAVTAAHEGASVSLFEKMPKVGLKMGITGKGRCNLTNSAPIMDFIAKTPGNGKFLYSAYEKFNNEDLLSLFHTWGLATKVERGGRVFPKSDDAQEVRHLFMNLLRKERVDLHLEEPVRHILQKDGEVTGVATDRGTYEADAVILTTGGASYPRTGSTGDGYAMARELGHKLTAIRPALIPLVCAEEWPKELQGISLKNVTFSVDGGGRRKGEEFGEMLFTHFGVSGPIVLSLSVCGNAFEHFVGITSEIVAYWYHGRITKGYTCTSTKNMEIQEEHERENSCIFFTSHNPSVYRGFRRKGEE